MIETFSDKLILVISTQYPGYGGAATNAYALIQYLKKIGYNTWGIFIEQKKNVEIDPDKIGNIVRLDYYPYKYRNIFQIMAHRQFLTNKMKKEPDLIICKNYFSPVCAKQLYPNVVNIFLISGLDNIIERCGKNTINEIYRHNIKIPQNNSELQALINTTLAVANSPLTLKIFSNCYANFENKICTEVIDTSQYLINIDDTPMEKKYDLLITSSILTRPEKNNLFLIDILKDASLEKYSKIIVGENGDKFKNIPNCTVQNLLPHADLMNIMKQSKILLFPSLYDSNPNTVREAVYHKCLPLISNNVGYYEKFPPYLVCETYEHDEWIDKCVYLMNNYEKLIKYNMVTFDNDNAFLNLIQKFI